LTNPLVCIQYTISGSFPSNRRPHQVRLGRAIKMATTAREACGMVCLLVMVNSCGSQLDMCLPGDCSAWEWDTDGEERNDVERRGHCVLACGILTPQGDRKTAVEMH
jgi:hypothetical protein